MRHVRQVRDGVRRAYTLVELLIVIGILGMAAGLLTPVITGQDGMEVQAAVRKVIGDLAFAQSDALAHQEYRRVHFYNDGRGFAVVRCTQDNYDAAWDAATADYITDPLAGPGALGRYIVDFNTDDRFDGVSISDVDIDGAGDFDLVFDPIGGTIRTGNLPGNAGSISLTSGGITYRIDIAAFTGKLTVTRTAG